MLTIICVLAGVLFVVVTVGLWLNYREIEATREAQEREPAPAQHSFALGEAAAHGNPLANVCVLCSRPLQQPATSDQVVSALEQRIDADMQAIALHLREGLWPAAPQRRYPS